MSFKNTKKTRKRKHVLGVDDEELKHLEKIVLGDGEEIFNDTPQETVNKQPEEHEKVPAWVDEADTVNDNSTSLTISFPKKLDPKYRESRFYNVLKKPKWASYSAELDKDDILSKCGSLIKKSNALESGSIEIKRLTDLNSQTHNEGPITAIKFHTKSTVALVAGLSGIVSLVQVDGKENPRLQSTKYHKFPIESASFINNGEEYIIGSRHSKHFHCFNLMSGQNFIMSHKKIDGIPDVGKFVVSPDDKHIAVIGKRGLIYLLSTRTKECVDNFQLNSCVKAISFNTDGSKMYSHSHDGEVYIWDLKARKCLKKFTDDGCLLGTAIDVSSNDSLLACGSNSGVVNVYDINKVMSEKYQPLKIFYNLVTPITSIKFNPTSEILCVSSVHKKKAVKLIHLPSMTVFSNFPVIPSKVNKVTCIDFSPNGGYMALGDSKKWAHLFRLKYYGNY